VNSFKTRLLYPPAVVSRCPMGKKRGGGGMHNARSDLLVNGRRSASVLKLCPFALRVHVIGSLKKGTITNRKLQVLQSKCLRIATGAPWYMSNRQIHEDLGVPFFADHVRALTESLDSKLADAGNLLVRHLGRYLR
jgi:hypothetical protein